MTHLPKFSAALLHPRYWLLWLGIGLLWLVVQLPYPLIYRLGTGLGRLAMRRPKSPTAIWSSVFPIRASKSVTAWSWQTLNPSAWG
jgi:lauroyl/myristoyl acyltransferase